MKKYKIVDQAVEINGVKYYPDNEVTADKFASAPKLSKEQIANGLVATSELESLLSTGHIIEI